MSAHLLGTAWDCNMGSAQSKLLVMKMVDCCDDDGSNIFPSVHTLAVAAQCSERHVQRELRKFVKFGLLEVDKEGGKGPRSTTHYHLNLNALKRIGKIGWAAYRAEKGDTESSLKGDTESPLTPCKGDSDVVLRVTEKASKGDTRSHPTPPDPSLDPSTEREARARNRTGELHGRFRRLAERYPGSVNDRLNVAERIWARELTDGERARAENMLDSFVRATNGSRRRSPLQEYLSERKFDLLAAEDTAPASRQAELAGDQPQFVSVDDSLWQPVAAAWRRESGKNVDPPIQFSETKNQKGWWFPKRLVARASAAPK